MSRASSRSCIGFCFFLSGRALRANVQPCGHVQNCNRNSLVLGRRDEPFEDILGSASRSPPVLPGPGRGWRSRLFAKWKTRGGGASGRRLDDGPQALGPGGRWFESTRPNQISFRFQTTKCMQSGPAHLSVCENVRISSFTALLMHAICLEFEWTRSVRCSRLFLQVRATKFNIQPNQLCEAIS